MWRCESCKDCTNTAADVACKACNAPGGRARALLLNRTRVSHSRARKLQASGQPLLVPPPPLQVGGLPRRDSALGKCGRPVWQDAAPRVLRANVAWVPDLPSCTHYVLFAASAHRFLPCGTRAPLPFVGPGSEDVLLANSAVRRACLKEGISVSDLSTFAGARCRSPPPGARAGCGAQPRGPSQTPSPSPLPLCALPLPARAVSEPARCADEREPSPTAPLAPTAVRPSPGSAGSAAATLGALLDGLGPYAEAHMGVGFRGRACIDVFIAPAARDGPLRARFLRAFEGSAWEMRLVFHGTPARNIDSLVSRSFDPTRRGVHGQACGWGDYFGSTVDVTAPYSNDSNRVLVFAVIPDVARVLPHGSDGVVVCNEPSGKGVLPVAVLTLAPPFDIRELTRSLDELDAPEE